MATVHVDDSISLADFINVLINGGFVTEARQDGSYQVRRGRHQTLGLSPAVLESLTPDELVRVLESRPLSLTEDVMLRKLKSLIEGESHHVA